MRTNYRKLQLSRCGKGSPLPASDPCTLPGVQPNDLLGVGSLGNLLISLGEHKLYVAGVGHVWVDLVLLVRMDERKGWMEPYTTVSTVCSAALLGGLVDLDVLDDQVTGVETLGISVGFRLEH